MAYYGRRRYNPAAEERREREAKTQARIARDRKRLYRLLAQVRKIPLKGAASKHAWESKSIRSFHVGEHQGSAVYTTIRTDGRHLYLQEADYMGWALSRLVPKHHVPQHEIEDAIARDRTRRR